MFVFIVEIWLDLLELIAKEINRSRDIVGLNFGQKMKNQIFTHVLCSFFTPKFEYRIAHTWIIKVCIWIECCVNSDMMVAKCSVFVCSVSFLWKKKKRNNDTKIHSYIKQNGLTHLCDAHSNGKTAKYKSNANMKRPLCWSFMLREIPARLQR